MQGNMIKIPVERIEQIILLIRGQKVIVETFFGHAAGIHRTRGCYAFDCS